MALADGIPQSRTGFLSHDKTDGVGKNKKDAQVYRLMNQFVLIPNSTVRTPMFFLFHFVTIL